MLTSVFPFFLSLLVPIPSFPSGTHHPPRAANASDNCPSRLPPLCHLYARKEDPGKKCPIPTSVASPHSCSVPSHVLPFSLELEFRPGRDSGPAHLQLCLSLPSPLILHTGPGLTDSKLLAITEHTPHDGCTVIK